MDKERFLQSGLIEQYVLGLTSPKETSEVEKYASTFPEIQHEIEKLRKALEQYAMDQAIPPPPGLKEKMMGEIKELQSPTLSSNHIMPKSKTSYWPLGLSMVGVLGFAALAIFFYRGQDKFQQELKETQQVFATYKKECEDQQVRLQQQANLYAFVSHQKTLPVQLKGTQLSPASSALVYYNTQSERAYLNIISLPEPPSGKQYQIWADVEGKMIDMGVIENAATAFQELRFIDHAESFNITLEPFGGSNEPTVSLLMVNGYLNSANG